MNIKCLLISSAAALLTVGAVQADEPVRSVKPKPPATQTAAPVNAPMPAVTSASALDKATLNPQPLPPKVWGGTPGANNSLNPQPLPPKVWGGTLGANSALNPQPLPPKVGPDPGIMRAAGTQAKTQAPAPAQHKPSKDSEPRHDRVCVTYPCP